MDGCLSLQPWELQLLHRTITSLANTIDQKTTKPSMLRFQPALAILTIASSCLSISPSLHLSISRHIAVNASSHRNVKLSGPILPTSAAKPSVSQQSLGLVSDSPDATA